MQLCFVSVHGPREAYFVDEPRILIQFIPHRKHNKSPFFSLEQVVQARLLGPYIFQTITREP
jgi:hypothetical protein